MTIKYFSLWINKPAGIILHKKDIHVMPIGVIHFMSPMNPKIIHEIGSPNFVDH